MVFHCWFFCDEFFSNFDNLVCSICRVFHSSQQLYLWSQRNNFLDQFFYILSKANTQSVKYCILEVTEMIASFQFYLISWFIYFCFFWLRKKEKKTAVNHLVCVFNTKPHWEEYFEELVCNTQLGWIFCVPKSEILRAR